MKKLPLFLFLLTGLLFAQAPSGIRIPEYDDDYTILVRKLEKFDLTIDFKELRYSWLQSEQYRLTKDIDLTARIDEMQRLFNSGKEMQAASIAKEILSINYTVIKPHIVLHSVYKKLHDTLNTVKHYEIMIGLVSSILKSGDGKSCETAWVVLDKAEQDYILLIYDARVNDRSDLKGDNTCQKVYVSEGKDEKTLFFRIIKSGMSKEEN